MSVLAELLFDQFHRREDRAFGQPVQKPGGSAGYDGQVGNLRAGLVGRAPAGGQQAGGGAQEGVAAVQHGRAGIFAGHRKVLLARAGGVGGPAL